MPVFDATASCTLVNVHRKHLNAMPFCIVDECRWRPESHGLGVEQANIERCWIVVFEPCGLINEYRKRCRMTLRKRVATKRAQFSKDHFGNGARYPPNFGTP